MTQQKPSCQQTETQKYCVNSGCEGQTAKQFQQNDSTHYPVSEYIFNLFFAFLLFSYAPKVTLRFSFNDFFLLRKSDTSTSA